MAVIYGQLTGVSGFTPKVVSVDADGRLLTSAGPADALADGSTAVTSSDAIVVDMSGVAVPRNIWVIPSSATVSVEYSTDGGNTYSDWPAGDVTAATSDTLIYPVSAIRLTKVSGTSFTYGVE